MNNVYQIYTDGSTKTNPGKGGWATIILNDSYDNGELVLSGHSDQTTNNQMEFMPVLEGISIIPALSDVIIYSDSALLIGYLFKNWKRNNYFLRKIAEDIDKIVSYRYISIYQHKVKGHSGDIYNERCDLIAKSRMSK